MFHPDAETTIVEVDRLLRDPLLDQMENIHITGGEPILSPKTYSIFKVIHETHPDIRVNMPVSGFFPEVTYRYCKKLREFMPHMRVDVSLDGPPEVHKLTRGDTYADVIRTVDKLRTLNIFLQLQLTVTPSNFMHIDFVQDLAKDMDIGFYITFPHYSSRFGHDKNEHMERFGNIANEIDRQIHDTWCAKREMNMRTWLVQKAIWEGKRVLCDCHMGETSIDMDPFGNVYPCMVYNPNQIFGNIKLESLSDMIASSNARRIFREIAERRCQPCLMPCCPSKANFTVDGKEMVFN
jgi:radical SAM protein with 4Fe4S-binding SPASM domain